ncbi:MAG TPA: arginine repressor [Acidimicrobiia bacterium]|jgi:transcriptional regulator of arginine metabolism|nr:arginine repressor [Acidimicrobiia bacterium]
MPDTAARRRAIRQIIAAVPIRSQAQLVEDLTGQGFTVTQATVSRDLGAMGVTKNGDRYAFRRITGEDRDLARTIAEYAERISSSGNLVVIKTPPGAAQVVAAAIDASDLGGLLGTVAGDDTVLIVTADVDGGAALQSQLEEMGGNR